MNPNQGREAAYVTSKVKDLSLITNTPDYVGCFACITPKAHGSLENDENVTYMDNQGNIVSPEVGGTKVYLPQLVRDVDTLDSLFGDPRVNPEVYKDLYAVRYIVQNGFACYIAKVHSGDSFSCFVNTKSLFSEDTLTTCPVNTQFANSKLANLKSLLSGETVILFNAESSIVGTNTLVVRLVPFKPYSLSQVSLELVFNTQETPTSEVNQVASARVILTPDTKNADLIKTLNSYLGGDLVLSLPDSMDDSSFASVADASKFIETEANQSYFCIANLLLYVCGIYDLNSEYLNDLAIDEIPKLVMDNMVIHPYTVDGVTYYGLDAVNKQNNPTSSDKKWPRSYNEKPSVTFTCSVKTTSNSVLSVSSEDYARSFRTYKDIKYSGNFISELSSSVTHIVKKDYTIYVDNYVVVSSASLENGEEYYVNSNEFTSEDPAYTSFTYNAEVPNIPTATLKHTLYSDNTLTTPVAEADLVDDTDYYYNNNEGTSGAESVQTFHYTTGASIPTYSVNHTVYTINGKKVEPNPDFSSTPIPSGYYINSNEGTSNSDIEYEELDPSTVTERPQYDSTEIGEISADERRGLHNIIKEVAALRKNLTCVFTTPYKPYGDDHVIYDLNIACDWVAARGDFADLFDYGTSNTTVYAEQAFYCEMYWSWLKWRVAKLVNGMATGTSVIVVPASAFVILNSLASFRSRGTFYPVAGDQGGVLPDSLTILQNPSTKAQRDKLISYRINPIFDTGVRGIQIYGNDTLNPQYTDLSAAHIARTLVNIRSRVDEYSETIKFSLNNQITWGSWINYVTTKILEPIKALGGLQWYQADMGYNTTERDEIANRKIRGMISLQFTQSLEIIDLEFVVYASSLNMEEQA